MQVEERVRELVARGDLGGAATEAIRAHGPVVLSYLRPMLRDEDEVADAFSRWAENVWKGLASFEGRSSIRTWCLRLACNVALNLRDRAHRRRERRLFTGEASAVADQVRTKSVVRVERQRQRLLALRAQLTPEEQTLLFLRVDQELSWEEIARILSEGGAKVSADTTGKRFERLKARLQGLVRGHGQ